MDTRLKPFNVARLSKALAPKKTKIGKAPVVPKAPKAPPKAKVPKPAPLPKPSKSNSIKVTKAKIVKSKAKMKPAKYMKMVAVKVKNGPKYALHKMVPQSLLVDANRLVVMRPTNQFFPIDSVFEERTLPDADNSEDALFEKQLRDVLSNILIKGTGFPPLMPQRHFTWLLVARRESGKSNLLNNIIKGGLVTYRVDARTEKLIKSKDQFFKKKILFAPTAGLDKSLDATSFDEIYRTKAEIENVIKEFVKNKARVPTLFVGDDVQGWCSHEANSIISWFATVNRHYGASLIISVQNLKQGLSPSIRNNLSDFTNFRIALESERRKMQDDIGADFITHYNMIDWNTQYQYMHMKVTKGPTLWYFQGVTPETIAHHEANISRLLDPSYATKWKLIGKG